MKEKHTKRNTNGAVYLLNIYNVAPEKLREHPGLLRWSHLTSTTCVQSKTEQPFTLLHHMLPNIVSLLCHLAGALFVIFACICPFFHFLFIYFVTFPSFS